MPPQPQSSSTVRPAAPVPTSPALSGAAAGPGGSSAAPGEVEARLIVIAEDGTPGDEFPLREDQVDVGRQYGTILLPNDPYASPRHARITRRQGQLSIRDLNSVNGVYVRLRAPHPLVHGDLFLIGLQVLSFEVVNSEEPGLGAAIQDGVNLFGSPAAPRYARLRQRTVEGVDRNVYYIGNNETVLGRESGDIVFASDPFMSRSHAAIVRDPTDHTLTLRDLGSSNGTFVALRAETRLESGDYVRIGQHLFRLDVHTGRRS